MKNITSKDEFEKEVIEKSKEMPVAVDFWASWCGPCQMFGPIFEKVSKELEGKAGFVKVSVEEAQEIAQEYEVRSIPAIKVFKDGEVVDEAMGMLPEDALKNMVEGKI